MRMTRVIKVGAGVLLCGLVLATVAFLMNSTHLKRKAPPSITPVVIGTNEFRVPNTIQTEGIVEAWNVGGRTLLWQKKIYSTPKLPGFLMETDVQYNFITNMTVGPDPDELSIANEKGQQYILNTSSRKVRRK